jgi:hypothetical protein
MVTIGDLLGIDMNLSKPRSEHEPEPEKIVAPIPKPPRVIGDPTRTPVNKQAAMMLSRPVPMPPEKPKKPEPERLLEENAKLKAANQNLVDENCALRRRVERMEILLNKRISQDVGRDAQIIPPNMADTKKQQLLERLHGI